LSLHALCGLQKVTKAEVSLHKSKQQVQQQIICDLSI